jgi:hypothetical protein
MAQLEQAAIMAVPARLNLTNMISGERRQCGQSSACPFVVHRFSGALSLENLSIRSTGHQSTSNSCQRPSWLGSALPLSGNNQNASQAPAKFEKSARISK